ncbi:hypothetical protein [Methylophaga marina]|uniref:hypothetical protein n=1 Tax=Methylophaga marina TaxID=45495 RepID=UPI0031D7D0BD
MNRHHLWSLMLVICMVFSTSASAFLHIDEHSNGFTHTVHQHDIDEHHHDDHDSETEHTHHYNLHVIGDLVEHKAVSLIKSVSIASGDDSSQLISRKYSPPIPPPDA